MTEEGNPGLQVGMASADMRSRPGESGWFLTLLALLFAGLFWYSQVTTLDWDEGFHLVAARLILEGKRTYIDFCFPQPSLHVWWNALWLRLTGDGWRGPHVAATLLACGAIWMTADFARRRISGAFGAVPAACIAAIFTGLNAEVYEFGTKAQAYGACLFLTVAAFRVTLATTRLSGAAGAGCLAGASAGCSLLAAPSCVVLLLWHALHRRWRHAGTFLLGAALPLLPLLLYLWKAPFQTWFNLVEYHVSYRHVGWTGALQNDLRVLTSWIDSGQALLLGFFALTGLWFVHRSGWSRKTEFYLAGWMAAGLALEAAVAHPTFSQYFVLVVPFLSILGAAGFSEIASRFPLRARWMVPWLAALLLLSLSNSLTDMRDSNNTWTGMASIAGKIEQVTPPSSPVLADPPVYFALHRDPPSGMEFPASHRVEVPPATATALHIVPQSELERRVRHGDFATAETCNDDDSEIQALSLPRLYSQSVTIAGCTVYWGFK